MTKKEAFQKELQEKVKAGVKPSQIKKSKSLESLPTKSPKSQEVKELKAQITALLEQISRIKQEANQSLQTQEQTIKELTTKKNKLTDSNNELRLTQLKTADHFTKYQQASQLTNQLKLQLAKLQKDLTISQQDLKSAQRVIELRTLEPESKDNHQTSFDY
jgi:hypothetical protein